MPSEFYSQRTRLFYFLLSLLILESSLTRADDRNYPAAGQQPRSQPGWQSYLTTPDLAEPEDEAQSGHTLLGTLVAKRTPDCFPAETRNVFYLVDQVAGADGKLCPLNFQVRKDPAGIEQSRKAIQGQNTWMLWAEGNEAFWGWLQEKGYGIVDFLVLLDSRQREHRFATTGMINQPGMVAGNQNSPLYTSLGLYLDLGNPDPTLPGVKLTPPAWDQAVPATPPKDPVHQSYPVLFQVPEAGNPENGQDDPHLYEKVIAALPKDGVDSTIYGYPSGVIGLRLFPNPDFFADTASARKARNYWMSRVRKPGDPYYKVSDSVNNLDVKISEVHEDPQLVRPFRVGMTCAFCHIGPHPLNPPADVEHPKWENLSSIIGNQYWNAAGILTNTTKKQNFVHYFLQSQQAGTIDTSLVSSDNINNPNAMNAIFQVPARLQRALEKPAELQNKTNLLMPGTEDAVPNTNPRHTPAILMDAADSVGVFGALARVYLNIGTFPEEWNRCSNPLVGFVPQKPFAITTLRAKSVYWRTSEQFRVPYLAAFFTYQTDTYNSSTATMRLKDAAGEAGSAGKNFMPHDSALVAYGRQVFLSNCAICHSSKQPTDFNLLFTPHWKEAQGDWVKQVPIASNLAPPVDRFTKTTISATVTNGAPPAFKLHRPAHLSLPMNYEEWDSFKTTAAYQDYVAQIEEIAVAADFFENNYLSTDLRIPVTLVGTNSGRSMGTNGMRGQMWDNFSSETYKSLPSVGTIKFYNPYFNQPTDGYGNNDSFVPPSGGPGYYRPASLVSLWTSAPYLHNNSLGIYNNDPSVRGRMAAYEDGMSKLLSGPMERAVALPPVGPTLVALNNHRDGDLRFGPFAQLAAQDPGFIYRTPHISWLMLPGKFIRGFLEGILGSFWTEFISLYLWLILALMFGTLFAFGRQIVAGIVSSLLGILFSALLLVTRLETIYVSLILLPLVSFFLAFLCFRMRNSLGQILARTSLFSFLALSIAAAGVGHAYVSGRYGPVVIGPIPMGTPVNLLMNYNPEAPFNLQIEAASGLIRGLLILQKEKLTTDPLDVQTAVRALHLFETEAGMPLMKASKCPDFVLDRGHWFGQDLKPGEKLALIEFLKTL